MVSDDRSHIAVIGSGAAGLSAAWLLSRRHKVTLLEKDRRLGGHSHTATVVQDHNQLHHTSNIAQSAEPSLIVSSDHKIDTGFIVYNEPSYPNLSRWFEVMNVATENSDMSFAVSRDNGKFEYAGGPALGLLAQPSLLLKPRFWRMLKDLVRFYRSAHSQIPDDATVTLGEFLHKYEYSEDFIQDHLLPFGAAIWSTPKSRMLEYPASAFIRFCENHGLLQITNRPQWKTVTGGSEQYVNAVAQALGPEAIQTDFEVARIVRSKKGVTIHDSRGQHLTADHAVVATHADQALRLLDQPSHDETSLLSVFHYASNHAYLHTDSGYLPERRRAWCSWNYVERGKGSPSSQATVSYWMNKLQNIKSEQNYIVTLNPEYPPADDQILRSAIYDHPVFTAQTWIAQQKLWSLQGQERTWFCGSYFGSGFHEDAVQSGLAVAEQLGGEPRPWVLDSPSSRIVVPSKTLANLATTAGAAA